MKGAERVIRDATAPARPSGPAAAAARTDTAAGPPRPARGAGGLPTPDATLDSTLGVTLNRFANDLAAGPGIEEFEQMRLGDLDGLGSSPLRTMWQMARDELGSTYGDMTVGEFIDRYGGASPSA